MDDKLRKLENTFNKLREIDQIKKTVQDRTNYLSFLGARPLALPWSSPTGRSPEK